MGLTRPDNNGRVVWEEQKVKERQKIKFNLLQGESNRQAMAQMKNMVVDLSYIRLTPAMESILAKGLNYALAPKTIPVKEVVCRVEMALKDVPGAGAEELRSEVGRLLKTANPSHRNVSRHKPCAKIVILWC